VLVDFILETKRRDGGNVGRAISSRCLMVSNGLVCLLIYEIKETIYIKWWTKSATESVIESVTESIVRR
jgi:hypothetical protein